MDEGEYDCKVDIWSVGICCIELGGCLVVMILMLMILMLMIVIKVLNNIKY